MCPCRSQMNLLLVWIAILFVLLVCIPYNCMEGGDEDEVRRARSRRKAHPMQPAGGGNWNAQEFHHQYV